jgi:hypothetical protein
MARPVSLSILLLAAGFVTFTAPLFGQTPDTLVVRADTLDAAPDTSAFATPPLPLSLPPFPVDSVVAFARDHRGVLLDTIPPERGLPLYPTEALESVPGAFVYSFRTGGWPEGFSVAGRDPSTAVLLRDGRPFHSLTTGRALFEMLPLGLSDPPRLARGMEGGSTTLVANMQTFDSPRPITGIRYQSDDNGLQHAEVYHAQRRLVTVFGRQALLNVSAAYLGRGSTGEYPGSVLERERGVFVQTRFARPRWSLAISNLSSRHRVGAHAGVVPQPPAVYETIFVRPGAVVRRPEARRQTVRNEFDVTWRARWLADPFTLTGYWTAESYRYYDARLHLPARLHRAGVRAEQHLRDASLPLRIHGWIETVQDDSAFVSPGNRYAFEASLADSLRIGIFGLEAEAGIRATHRYAAPGGRIRLSAGAASARAYVSAESAPLELPRIFEDGFGPLLAPTTAGAGRSSEVRIGASVVRAPFSADAFVLAQSDRDGVFASTDAARDTLVLHTGVSTNRVGAGGRFGFRESAGRGVYASVSPSLVRWLAPPALAGTAPIETSVPALHIYASLGVRAMLFQGDLDADVSVRGRYWSAMRSRVLHPATGLLVLAEAEARHFNASGFLDVVLEAGVRTATIHVALENVLSGTDVTLGNLIVPDYPLPERRLRFAVFWPILD